MMVSARDAAERARPCAMTLLGKLGALRLRMTTLWKQIRRLGIWLEAEVFPAAAEAGETMARFDVDPTGAIRYRPRTPRAPTHELADLHRLCEFLGRLGLARLELEVRLDSNQISAVLTLLHSRRRKLWRQDGVEGCRRRGQTGVEFACARTRIREETLVIEYSYCMTRFSRAVKWFERRHRAFGDHRVLFHSAPYYAGLAAAAVPSVFVAYALGAGWWVLLISTLLAAAFLAGMVYLFFMIVGSVEYDREEREHHLRLAHDELERYTQRTRADLAGAREVQEGLIPDASDMPMQQHIEWASKFIPEVEVGGDYFDAAATEDGQVAILFADVCGHGMSAALITAILKTTFQAWLDDGEPIERLVHSANRNLCRFTPEGSFAVLIVATYDPQSRRLRYVNCGHHPEPIRIPANPEAPVESLRQLGSMLLGVIEDVPADAAECVLSAGDRLVFMTDGIIEAKCADGDQYGRTRLDECIRSNRRGGLSELVDTILGDVEAFTADCPASDDRTILGMRIL